jgi:3,4-dihydroxy 2-butanone 4-phosphate synthase/GTP cyclohydrolase II
MVGDVEVGVISELVNEDGSMMRGDELQEFARSQSIPIVTIAALLAELQNATSIESHDSQVEATPAISHWANLPRSTSTGGAASSSDWKIAAFSGRAGVDHAVVKYGEISRNQPILVRIHSECLTGDVLGSLRCDCGSQLERALERIEAAGSGIVIYLRDQEGRGIGLSEKIRAYELQDQGLDTVEANLALGHEIDERDFDDAVDILKSLGAMKVTLLTNNPVKLQSLIAAGIDATSLTLQGEINAFNEKYIETKRERLGHK